MAETFALRIHRPRTLSNALRRYRLLVDGVELGSLESGATLTLEVPRGSRELVAKLDWVKSRPLALAALETMPAPAVDCVTSNHPLDTFKAAFGLSSDHITFVAHDAARVEREDPAKPAVRLREAALWLVGCAVAGGFLIGTVHNLAPSLAAGLTPAIGALIGLVAVAGAWSLGRK